MMKLLGMSFSGGVFIIAVTTVRLVLINKIPKKTFLILWEIAFLKLLIPFSVPFIFSIHTLINQVISNSTFGGTDVNTIISAWVQGQSVTTPNLVKMSSDVTFPSSILFVIWCIGMTALTLFFTISYLRCHIEFQTSLPISVDYVNQWLKERSIKYSIKRSISVRQSDIILTPLTYGILHPVILMPKQTDWNNTKQLQYVLSHEYIHICHLDALKKIIATIVLCIHWFNPFVWIMYILFNRDVELLCDECVVRQFGEKSKTDYSLILINMEENKNGVLPFCNGFCKNAIEERITSIMKMKKVTIPSFVAACFIIGGIVTAFATSAQSCNKQESAFNAPNMQPYGKGDNYYYLADDYILDGQTVFTSGYYEAVKLIDASETRIFIPIDPISYERLPSDSFSDGTIMEIDGNDYEIHINNNQYSAVLKR